MMIVIGVLRGKVRQSGTVGLSGLSNCAVSVNGKAKKRKGHTIFWNGCEEGRI
jgi:ribosome-associated protein YbcJ (S4-like RNA binding protein)